MIFASYYYVIWGTAFVTAIVSASIGMLGGTLLLSVMAQFLKMDVLIPVHGIIQFASNGTRAYFLRPYIDRLIAKENLVGVIIGSLLGAFFTIRIPEAPYSLLLGFFILTITFLPKFTAPFQFNGKWAFLGIVSSYLGLYIGAVGVLVGSFFLAEKDLNKKQIIASQAFCQTVLHLLKVFVFIHLGFAITPWVPLLLGTLVMTFAGTWVGTLILARVPEKLFRLLFKTVIVLLATRLIYDGLFGLL